jgi:hypothetical protein
MAENWALAEELAIEKEEVRVLTKGLKTTKSDRIKEWIKTELTKSVARRKSI